MIAKVESTASTGRATILRNGSKTFLASFDEIGLSFSCAQNFRENV